MSQKLAKLIFEKSNKIKSVPEVIHPIFAGKHLPAEHLAYISDKEAKMLRDNTDGKSNLTQWGPSSFVNMGPTAGMGSNYTPTSAYTYSTPSSPSTGSYYGGGFGTGYVGSGGNSSYTAPRPATPSSGGGSYYGGNFGTGYTGSGGNSSYSGSSSYGSNTGGQGSSSGAGSSSGSNNSGGGWTVSTGQGSSSGQGASTGQGATTGQGSSVTSSINNMIDNALSFADANGPAFTGQQATWNVTAGPSQTQPMTVPNMSTFNQGVNYSPADYQAAGYGQYQQARPASGSEQDTSEEPSFADWQIADNSYLTGTKASSAVPSPNSAYDTSYLLGAKASSAPTTPSIQQAGSTVRQGVNYSPADYQAAGYGQYQQPFGGPQQSASNDWIVGSPSAPKLQDRIPESAGPTQFAKDQSRIPEGSNAGNWTAATMPPSWGATPPTQVASGNGFPALPPPIPQSRDISYLTGAKASSAETVEDYRTPSYVAWQNSQIPSYLSGPKASSAVQIQQVADGGDGGGWPPGYQPNGPETPSGGLGATPDEPYIPPEPGGPYQPPEPYIPPEPWTEEPYIPPETGGGGQPPVAGGGNPPSPFKNPQAWLGSQMPAINDKVAGWISPLTSRFGTGEGFPNYASSTGGQGSSFAGHTLEDATGQSSSSDAKTYASQDDFAADHRKLHGEKLAKLWSAYLAAHPNTGTTTASSGPVGAAYSIATSRGNYIVDSRGNYFMMGPDRSYIQVPAPQGAVA